MALFHQCMLTSLMCPSHKRLTQQKKQRERERKELELLGRRHLANVRVVQRNVVYVVGMGPRFAKEEVSHVLILSVALIEHSYSSFLRYARASTSDSTVRSRRSSSSSALPQEAVHPLSVCTSHIIAGKMPLAPLLQSTERPRLEVVTTSCERAMGRRSIAWRSSAVSRVPSMAA